MVLKFVLYLFLIFQVVNFLNVYIFVLKYFFVYFYSFYMLVLFVFINGKDGMSYLRQEEIYISNKLVYSEFKYNFCLFLVNEMILISYFFIR